MASINAMNGCLLYSKLPQMLFVCDQKTTSSEQIIKQNPLIQKKHVYWVSENNLHTKISTMHLWFSCQVRGAIIYGVARNWFRFVSFVQIATFMRSRESNGNSLDFISCRDATCHEIQRISNDPYWRPYSAWQCIIIFDCCHWNEILMNNVCSYIRNWEEEVI